MTLAGQVAAWIDGDPDPKTRDELAGLSDTELAQRFSSSLAFGTAGLRGPVQAGPTGMNVAVVTRTTAALAAYLSNACLGGSEVVVGRDARTGSDAFAAAAAEVFAAAGFRVTLLPRPLPTPVLAFAVRSRGAAAGVQITASHNPAADNGYKVYLDGGAQLISPADREIETLIGAVGPASAVSRTVVEPTTDDIVGAYLDRVALLAHSSEPVRIALTALHGVGGAVALDALARTGFSDVVVVEEQFEPDPAFPTVTFPNPEEPGAADLLLALAERSDADIAIALDPDADRCAVGVASPDGWRMLTGDETGSLLTEWALARAAPDALVANTIVSSTLMSKLAPARGARYARTLTGFKWLVRAGDGLAYAYEEAIGHCVDPKTVRDKDGVSAAVALASYASSLKASGRTFLDVLDDLAVEFGLHAGSQVSRRVTDLSEIAAMMKRLRSSPPADVAGIAVAVTDHSLARGQMRTDAVELTGDGVRVIVRPSGTEPKLKAYLEVVVPVTDRPALGAARETASARLDRLREFAEGL
ncbi:putative phosphomannomutase PmmB [Rhodococcoides trifolii]|uniref:Phosphomannomutase PmmB n=1 Tax=Rhodococcoides trifolii TaxID=908250 RepID=A0A917D8M1_9NOCA|nr:phospho-sugar mutase [Rhodococcus trifolii]GGG13154.1 putative phosphomannomutase PmmB [Rhodococcus trifolii]